MSGETWISVGQLSEGFESGADGYRPAPSAALAGRRLVLDFEDGSRIGYHFESATELTCAPHSPPRSGAVAATYRATEIRSGIFFVDYIAPDTRASTVSLVLDLERRVCTILYATLPEEADARLSLVERARRPGGELTGVAARYLSGTVDRPFADEAQRHEDSDDMIGRRVEYTYSSTERYEHIYLNRRFYTWHCLSGSERGLADTDLCRYLKIAERLYFFSWREKIVPTLGAVLVDFEQMRTTGKIFGYRGFDFGAVVNIAVGAHARLAGTHRTTP